MKRDILLIGVVIALLLSFWYIIDTKIKDSKTKEVHTIEKTIEIREGDTKRLDSLILDLKGQIKKTENKFIYIKEEIPVPEQRDSYFNNRYSTQENSIFNNKTVLGDSTSYKVIYELKERDIFKKLLPQKDRQISLMDSVNFNLLQDKRDLNRILGLEREQNKKDKKKELLKDIGIFGAGVLLGNLATKK